MMSYKKWTFLIIIFATIMLTSMTTASSASNLNDTTDDSVMEDASIDTTNVANNDNQEEAIKDKKGDMDNGSGENTGITAAKKVKTTADNANEISADNKKSNSDKTLKTAAASVKNYDELYDAITTSTESDLTITLEDGTYTITDTKGQITIPSTIKNITINGNANTINGQGQYSFIYVSEGINATINNITVTNCFNDNSGAVMINWGNLTVTNSNFKNNKASISGAVISSYQRSNLTIVNCTFDNNTAQDAGAINCYISTTKIINSTFTNHETLDDGGVIEVYNRDTLIDNSIFINNTAGKKGGVIKGNGYTINNCTFINNMAREGGVACNDYNGMLNISNSKFENNQAMLNGQAIFNEGSIVAVNNAFTNAIKPNGDFIYNANIATQITYENNAFVTFINSYPELIKQIDAYNDVGEDNLTVNVVNGNYDLTESLTINPHIKYLTINGNGSTFNGQGIYQFMKINNGVTVNLNNLTIANCTANNGGAIENYGALNARNTAFLNNSATNYGGAIYNNNGTLNTRDTTFLYNNASYGGVIYNSGDSYSTLNNSKFNSNHALTGGAIYSLMSTLNIGNSTFNNNSATDNGGLLYVMGDVANLSENIITNNAVLMGNIIYVDSSNFNAINNTFINNTNDNKDDILFNYDENGYNEYIKASNNAYINNNLNTSVIINLEPLKSGYNINANVLLCNVYNGTVKNGTAYVSINGNLYARSNITDGLRIIPVSLSKLDNVDNEITVNYTSLMNEYNYKNSLSSAYITRNQTALNDENYTVSDKTVIMNVKLADITSNNAVANAKLTVYDMNNTVLSGNYTGNDGVATICLNWSDKENQVVTIKYDGTHDYLPSSATANIHTKKYTNTTLNPIIGNNGDNVTITAITTDESGNNVTNGTVIFILDDTLLSTVSVDNGIATTNITLNKKYNNALLIAKYGGNDEYHSSQDSTTLIIGLKTANITLEDSVIESYLGENVTFKVSVSANDVPIDQGNVIFKLNGKTLIDPTTGKSNYIPVVNGRANFTYFIPTNYSYEYYNITAVYSGQDYERAEATGILLIIKKNTTIATELLKTNAINTTIKITVKSNDSLIGNGIVYIYDNNKYIANTNLANGTSVVELSPLSLGNKVYTFYYAGDKIYNSSGITQSIPIALAGTNIKVQVLKNNLVNLTFNITVKTGNIPVKYGTIQIYEDNTLIKEASITDGRLKMQVLPTSLGVHKYRVVYLTNELYNKNSWIDDVNIIKAGTNMKIETLKSNAANTTLKITVKTGEYQYVQSGYVNVYHNGKVVGKACVENGIATVTATPNKTGLTNYTIKYIGDDTYDSSASQSQILNITQAGTNIDVETLESKTTNTTLKVTVKTANTPVTKGTVDAIYNNQTIATGTVSNGESTLTMSLPEGLQEVKIAYHANDIYDYNTKQTVITVKN